MNTDPLTKNECDVLLYYLDRLYASTPSELVLPIQQVRGLALAHRTMDDSHSRKVERGSLRLLDEIATVGP